MSDPKTILLKGEVLGKEAAAGGDILPGDLIELNSAGAVVRHSTESGVAAAAFARELEFAGGTIDDAYESGDTVPYYVASSGAEIYARLADNQEIAVGDFLESAGDGTLQALTPFAQAEETPFGVTPEGHAVAVAVEAVTTDGAVARIKVEVL